MEDDVAAGRPMLAALCVSKMRPGIPARGQVLVNDYGTLGAQCYPLGRDTSMGNRAPLASVFRLDSLRVKSQNSSSRDANPKRSVFHPTH
jgi:hypothetical protein